MTFNAGLTPSVTDNNVTAQEKSQKNPRSPGGSYLKPKPKPKLNDIKGWWLPLSDQETKTGDSRRH